MPQDNSRIRVKIPPFETQSLRKGLTKFLDREVKDPVADVTRKLGNFKWGVYAFFDYDGEPIYVGQTNEMLRTRIRRHLTNQRTDAVAMSVLDPFEVFEIEVWPLPQFQQAPSSDREAKLILNALENSIYEGALERSRFHAVLNEKDPPIAETKTELPQSYRGQIVDDEVFRLRAHPDLRIARRALIISRLAQVISERKVQGGLRRVLHVQAQRLSWLAEQRYIALGGALTVEKEDEAAANDDDEPGD